ncbi:MAG: hypothetical protein PHV34_19355 [Verrucomicrobiae bacterium]|nr:hypothetical protein [Verrucomicrobiae bacterium]
MEKFLKQQAVQEPRPPSSFRKINGGRGSCAAVATGAELVPDRFKKMKKIIAMFFVLAALPSAWAVRTEKWRHDSQGDFSEGEAHGVGITSDGFLCPGPEIKKDVSLPAEVIWAVAAPRDGGRAPLYVAAGNEGQVFKVAADKAVEFFKAKEIQVHALAVDGEGNLFAGSSPDGKVHRIAPDGASSVFFEPKEKYIWALAWDEAGKCLYVATGDKGKLYKLDRDGRGGIFYDSDEPHLRCLLLDERKRLWVGSDGGGQVFRFDSLEGNAGKPFVVYDSDYREVKSLAMAPDGGLFAACIGDGRSSGGAGSVISSLKNLVSSIKAPGGVSGVREIKDGENGPKVEDVSFKPVDDGKPGMGEVVRIGEDGVAEKWWSGNEDVYSLMALEANKVWLGTGRKGRLIEVAGPRIFSVLGNLEAKAVNALWQNKEGLQAATSNGGAVWLISNKPARKGTYESKVLDARTPAAWGKADWTMVSGEGKMVVSTRSGNTAKPDKVWNDWVAVDDKQKIRSQPARYLQYRLAFEIGGEGRAAWLDRMVVFYQPRNLPPQLGRITIGQPNAEYYRMPKVEIPSGSSPMPNLVGGSLPGVKGGGAGAVAMAMRPPGAQIGKHQGWRGATWQASDPNGDSIRYDVYYRWMGVAEWKTLKQDLDEPFVSWDAATWPDGQYFLKVVANDRLSNPAGEERVTEMVGDIFTIDHTPPSIQADVSPQVLRKGILTLTVSDTVSVVKDVQVSVDGSPWRVLLPVGNLYDSLNSVFHLPVDALEAGEHYVNVRAVDAAENAIAQTVRFKK